MAFKLTSFYPAIPLIGDLGDQTFHSQDLSLIGASDPNSMVLLTLSHLHGMPLWQL